MSARRPELADIVREHGAEYLQVHGDATSAEQRRVLKAIAECRSAALGGHAAKYSCGHVEVWYNSCRNRHCPKCQGEARKEWMEAQAADLLEVPYFHVVFTLPEPLGPLALQNQRVLYGLLFRAAAETLLTIARDPKRLGAEIGFLAVLHTWGQNLRMHPHLHCLIPGGGFSPGRSRWIHARKRFFLPVRVLSRLFRRKFLADVRDAFESGKIGVHGQLAALSDKKTRQAFLTRCARQAWVVYAKPPFGSPATVVKYLARYTHRVAIGNERLLALDDGKVTFSWKDYARGGIRREMTLEALEFLRRFLQHILPKGFVRIRHYGFLANPVRKQRLALARSLLGSANGASSSISASESHADDDAAGPRERDLSCPVCRQGRLVSVEELGRESASATFLGASKPFDTS